MEGVRNLFGKLKILLEMIQFKLTVFALPFALIGAFLAANGVPSGWVFFWVIIAMVGARTCAMGFNRIADRHLDKDNPRTASRAIPAGQVSLKEAWMLVVISGLIFFFACYKLNVMTMLLAPVGLGLTLFYSLTKRFTSFCHLILGLALAFSPLGGWVAVSGSFDKYPYLLSLGVLFWVAGFDTIYGCLDTEFDKKVKLHSLPAKIGMKKAFRLAGLFHIVAFILFTVTGIQANLNWVYYIGIIITAFALLHQHRLVAPEDLSKINVSFFRMNGIISVTLFLATWLSLISSNL